LLKKQHKFHIFYIITAPLFPVWPECNAPFSFCFDETPPPEICCDWCSWPSVLPLSREMGNWEMSRPLL